MSELHIQIDRSARIEYSPAMREWVVYQGNHIWLVQDSTVNMHGGPIKTGDWLIKQEGKRHCGLLTLSEYLREFPSTVVTLSYPIGWAIELMEAGKKVSRSGWNGKGMSLEMQKPDAHSKMTMPYVFMNTACGNRVPWLCSQADLLATDWGEVL